MIGQKLWQVVMTAAVSNDRRRYRKEIEVE